MRIDIDINGKTMKTDFSWQFGFGCDHAPRLLRTDVLEHLRLARSELGIKTLRFHGIFDDCMNTYNNLKAFAPLPGRRNEVREINFRQCGIAYDNLLACGVKPFVELSFMPKALAKTKKTGLSYKNITSPPKSYEEWSEYITLFARFLINRYGIEEVSSWCFEVWNEPDLSGFFSGTKKDYFKLYEVTARALKAVDRRIKVGGPSTSACKWIEEFIEHCGKNDIPLDFISTHHYPGDAFGNFITPANYGGMAKIMMRAIKERHSLSDTMAEMFFHPEKAMQVPKGALAKMDDELAAKVGDLPLYMTEWNSMAIFAAPIHDEKYSAAFVMKTVLDLNHQFEGYQFWCLDDVFEEIVQVNKPFFGGYGIITNDGIPKPNFQAFKMLSRLGDERLLQGFRSTDEVEYAVFKKGNELQVIFFSQSNDPRLDKCFDVELYLNTDAKEVLEERIDDSHCNPKAVWLKMGAPDNPTPSEVEEIKKNSALTPTAADFERTDGGIVLKTTIHTNDIVMYTIKTNEVKR